MEQNPAIPAFTSTCRNCGAELGGMFCSHCGQEHRHDRLRFRDWLQDAIDSAASLDSRVWRTIAALTVRPGHMARDYVAGQRAPFVSPLRYAVATCALWWFAVMLNDEAQTSAVWWVEYAQFINLVSIPFIAAAYQAPFLGSRYNYVETLAFALYTTGQVFLWRVGFAVSGLIFESAGLLLTYIDSALYLVYTAWALWQFHTGRVRWLPLRIVGALLGALLLSAALYGVLALLAPAPPT